MHIQLPTPCLVALIGPTGSGKSSFARRHFAPNEVLSSDTCRGLVANDENDQTATRDAFDVLYYIAAKRLARGLLTVLDATHVKPEDRQPVVKLAREHDLLPVAIVFDLAPELCHQRNQQRPDRAFGAHVVRQHSQNLRRSLKHLQREGFRQVWVLRGPEEVEAVTFSRQSLWTDRRADSGPFDIIGDVHGCYGELRDLLDRLGYIFDGERPSARHPEGRKAVFLGDLVDRGPEIPAVLRLAMNMVEDGAALCVPGNHEVKLLRKLRGKDVRLTHGLAESLAQLEQEPPEFGQRVAAFIDGLVSHYVLDGGRLVVAHAGMKAEYQGRASGRVREFALYGETTGETDDYGLPVRYDWAADYRGEALVVYGHTPTPQPTWLNRTICIDTGCVFGGRLTALRYPERELVEVTAAHCYYEPVKPLGLDPAPPADSRPYADLLDIDDVLGKRVIATRFHHRLTVREENARAALEAMSRFAIDPHWLIYLPPTMSPSDTCPDGPWLEHPRESFAYFRQQGVPRVICEEKHMGSRAVVVLCRDEEAARRRFGVAGEGAIYTRTGRAFFKPDWERGVLSRLREAVEQAGFWARLATDWLCLDVEIMPWSAKAQELLRGQYAPVGAAAGVGLEAAVAELRRADSANPDIAALLARCETRREAVAGYVDAYRRYCWPVDSLDDLKIAPFHILAGEGGVYSDRDHLWHMDTLDELCRADPGLLHPTMRRVVDITDPADEQAGIAWWEALTARGGEGMVVKPLDWIVRGRRGLVQPALKCRGQEYLRIIYGPEYNLPESLERLRKRGLSAKRSLALREYALGLEALHRFVEREPLYRVHECVFAVLAMESEPVDPRL